MTFSSANFKELGGPGNSEIGGQAYSIFSPTDTLATMMASGYLNSVANRLHVRDVLLLSGTNGSQLVQVATNDGATVTVAAGDTVTSGDTLITGTLGVTGLTSLVNALLSGTLGVTGLASLVNAVLSGTLGVTGTSTLSGLVVLNQTAQAITGADAVDITSRVTEFTSDGSAQALTLVDGVVGQRKTVIHVVDGGSGVLTPANGLGYSTITFTTAGESVELEFRTGGWAVVGIGGLTATLPVVA